MEDVKRMDIQEFREEGFLQEVNRKFFHPLGLALEIIIEEDGSSRLGGIWDYRDDPEGMFFVGNVIDQAKIDNVEKLRKSKISFRVEVQNEYNIKVNKDGVQVI